jgi:UDP-N-acetylmuramoyl-tripeptide--D-alanyl-D-alanine ligase
MGASAQGEIKQLCGIAVPDYGVLTNIGRAHLEGFGSIEKIRSAKLEMLEFVRAVIVNADDEFLMDGLSNYKGRIIKFGIKGKADVFAKDIKMKDQSSLFTLCIGAKSIGVDLKMPGLFNIYNALAAAAVGDLFEIELSSIKAGIESFKGVPMRLEIRQAMGATVIYDVYNANPVSMQEVLKELVRMKKNKAIAVLGDMLELGQYAEEEHRKLGKLLADLKVDVFIAVGPLMSIAESEFKRAGRQSFKLENSSDAAAVLMGLCSENDTILIKGSRGMKMEKVLEINAEAKNAV